MTKALILMALLSAEGAAPVDSDPETADATDEASEQSDPAPSESPEPELDRAGDAILVLNLETLAGVSQADA